MRTRFLQGLDELKQKLLRMGGLAEQAVDRAVRAYRTRDLDTCKLVFEGEDAVNAIEREIDELALDLLAMQQPMAVDLRFIIAVVKINADLERVGDQAYNIAERVQSLCKLPEIDLPVDIPKMAEFASKMVRDALGSFLAGDAALAQSVLDADSALDTMNRDNSFALIEMMKNSPSSAEAAMNVLIVSRNLERVGDHATNIAEDVIFWVRGADVRHGHVHK
ncbi:MAG TPA: phosphate signaling complex protein PhoU [Terriglobales bacterium]|nr:phosphate signaling complex protein PhoU [Terriglobales bacterium]